MKLEDVFLDRYLKRYEKIEDFYAVYVNCYNGLSSDLQRINYAADLANLRQNYENQQYNTDSQIKSHQETLNQQIYKYAGVQPLTLDLDTVRLDPPDRNTFEDSLKGDADFFVVALDYFVNMLIFGFSDPVKMLDFQTKIYQPIKDQVEVNNNTPPNFSNLQEIIIHSIDHVALHRHWTTIAKILKEIARNNYPPAVSISALFEVHGDRGLKQSRIDQIIGDIAKSTSSKGTSTYEEKTISIYLEAYLERPNLTREDRLEVCISNTENEKVKSEFLDRCGSGILATWEQKLNKTIEEYKTVLSL